jgi:hypothetical protein
MSSTATSKRKEEWLKLRPHMGLLGVSTLSRLSLVLEVITFCVQDSAAAIKLGLDERGGG